MICREERTGGLLSANKITAVTENGYNFYIAEKEGKRVVIGGLPHESAEYNKAVKSADAVVLLTSKPEFNGGLLAALKENTDIAVYASPAGLRNIKEIINRDINEFIIKDSTELFGLHFIVTPNVHWVDTVMAVCDGTLFSGEMFSGFDGSAVGLKNYFDRVLSVNKPFVLSALDRLEKEDISAIYPAYGLTCPQGEVCISAEPHEVFAKYRSWAEDEKKVKPCAVVVYSSKYGFTKSLAECAINSLSGEFEVKVFDVSDGAYESAVYEINRADALVIGTNTINRNAPQGIWDVITRIDLVNKRRMPYFVFGSFGWAGDGIKLVDKTLTAMGMKAVVKPVEVLFKPTDDDFKKIEKAVEKTLAFMEII